MTLKRNLFVHLEFQCAVGYGSVNTVVRVAQLKFANVATKLYAAHTTSQNHDAVLGRSISHSLFTLW